MTLLKQFIKEQSKLVLTPGQAPDLLVRRGGTRRRITALPLPGIRAIGISHKTFHCKAVGVKPEAGYNTPALSGHQ